MWFLHNYRDGGVSNIPPRDDSNKKRSLDSSVIMNRSDNVKVSYPVDQLCSLRDARIVALAAPGPSEEVDILRKAVLDDADDGDGDGKDEDAWDITNFCRSSERGPFALVRVTSFFEPLSLSVPTTVVKAPRLIDEGNQVLLNAV